MKEISYIKWLYLEIILSLKSIIYYIKKHRFEVLQLKATQKTNTKWKQPLYYYLLFSSLFLEPSNNVAKRNQSESIGITV
jgi:hypothetical protein